MFTLWLAQCPVNCTVLSVIVWVSVACSCLVQWTTPGEHWPREASYSVWASVACNCLVHWHTPDNHWPRKVSYSVWASVAYSCLLHWTAPGWPLMPQAKLSLQQDGSHGGGLWLPAPVHTTRLATDATSQAQPTAR